jgi:ribose transport system ATP-binding protein
MQRHSEKSRGVKMAVIPVEWHRGARLAGSGTSAVARGDYIGEETQQRHCDVPLLQVRYARKCFAEASGLIAADLEVRRGEIHAIVGANGSGKTTLAKIIAGVHTQDAGELLYAGVPVHFTSPRQAQQHGIVAIHQEPQLVPYLTVADNIFLGDELMYRRVPLMHRRQMYEQSMDLLSELGAGFDAATLIARLGLAERQLVAIAKALHRKVTLCIMDEPTAALGTAETERLFAVLRRLRAMGVGVIYISHRLDEVLSLADCVTVMRDGRTVQTARIAEASRESLIGQIVGQDGAGEPDTSGAADRAARPIALQVEHLERHGVFAGVGFHIAAGEIYGLAGLAGAGRTEIARAIFGADRLDDGHVLVYGRQVRLRTPHDAIKAGIGMLSEDRKLDGLVLCQAANENVALTIW